MSKPIEHLHLALDRLSREKIIEAMERFDNNKSEVAEALGVSRYGLYHMLRRLGLDKAYVGPEAPNRFINFEPHNAKRDKAC